MAGKRSRVYPEMMMARKRSRVYPDWSNLNYDVLGNIFNGLNNIVEKRCFQAVCRSCWTLAKEEMNSLWKSSLPKSPLVLFPGGFPGGEGLMRKSGFCLFNLDDEGLKLVKMPLDASHILGSCLGGWFLLMTRDKTNLVLWNPFIGVKIHLPSVLTFPCVKSDFKAPENWITKAVNFGSDPLNSRSSGDVCGGVVVIYGGGKLAFVKYGDSQWSDLGGGAANENYSGNYYYTDVTCFKDSILALSNHSQVEVWNFRTNSEVPRKTMAIKVPFPQDMAESKEPLRNKYNHQLYIVVCQERVLLVVRWVAEFVEPDGLLLTEDDLIQEKDSIMIAPYKTKNFYVYQLDSDAKRWVGVESIGNQVLFLGGNQSVSLHAKDYSGCEKNSIYFTDDYWDRINEHEWFGGHDIGIFRLEDGSIDQVIPGFEDENILPPFFGNLLM